MKTETIRTMLRCETDGYYNIEMIGIIVCSCCINKIVEKNENIFDNLPPGFGILTTDDIIGKQPGSIIIGKFWGEIDEDDKTIKQIKEEVRFELDKLGFFEDDISTESDGVQLITGVIITSEDDERDSNKEEIISDDMIKKEIDDLLNDNKDKK